MEYEVRYSPIYYCDMPACSRWPTVEVRLIDGPPGIAHEQVCRQHVEWAKASLLKQVQANATSAAKQGAM